MQVPCTKCSYQVTTSPVGKNSNLIDFMGAGNLLGNQENTVLVGCLVAMITKLTTLTSTSGQITKSVWTDLVINLQQCTHKLT